MSTDRNSLSGTDAPSASDWLSAALAQIRRVEAAPLPANIGALLDGAAVDTPDRDCDGLCFRWILSPNPFFYMTMDIPALW